MSLYQSEMKVPIRPAPPPPVNLNASQKVSKPIIAWNGSAKVNHSKPSTSIPKKKPPPRPPPPKFLNGKQDKKPIPSRPNQLITSLFNKKGGSSKIGDPPLKPTSEITDTKGNNVLSLIDFNSPPSSPTFTTRSSSDALSVNSFGSDGITPCSTSSGNASNVESGFEDDFDFFSATSKKPDTQGRDPWSLACPEPALRSKNSSPMLYQNQKVRNKSSSWVTFSSSSTIKKNDLSVLPTIIRVKPERPKPPVKDKVTDSVSTSNVNVLADIFESTEQTGVNSMFQGGDDDDDGWSSESPPMPTCPPPPPPLEVLQSLLENSPDGSGGDDPRPHGVALYRFVGEHPDDLSFNEGDIVNLVRRIDDNWFVGEVGGRQGTVPANFISVRTALPGDSHVTALYAFHAETWGDLDFEEGAVIRVLSRINDDWLYGEHNGRTGQFPSNFVDRVPPELPLRDQ